MDPGEKRATVILKRQKRTIAPNRDDLLRNHYQKANLEENTMAAQQDSHTNRKKGRAALISCFVLFAIYLFNVILGKINISYGLNIPLLGHTAEFLMLFSACILLIVAALKRETAEKMLLTQTKTKKE